MSKSRECRWAEHNQCSRRRCECWCHRPPPSKEQRRENIRRVKEDARKYKEGLQPGWRETRIKRQEAINPLSMEYMGWNPPGYRIYRVIADCPWCGREHDVATLRQGPVIPFVGAQTCPYKGSQAVYYVRHPLEDEDAGD